jgi:hypothetical protein
VEPTASWRVHRAATVHVTLRDGNATACQHHYPGYWAYHDRFHICCSFGELIFRSNALANEPFLRNSPR